MLAVQGIQIENQLFAQLSSLKDGAGRGPTYFLTSTAHGSQNDETGGSLLFSCPLVVLSLQTRKGSRLYIRCIPFSFPNLSPEFPGLQIGYGGGEVSL